MELKPDDLTGSERYKLLIGCIVPRPIAFVSTISLEGRLNLAQQRSNQKPDGYSAGHDRNPLTGGEEAVLGMVAEGEHKVAHEPTPGEHDNPPSPLRFIICDHAV